MADETTKGPLDATSNDAASGEHSAPRNVVAVHSDNSTEPTIPEPVILEEHIVGPARTQPAPTTPATTPAAPIPKPPAPTPAKIVSPPEVVKPIPQTPSVSVVPPPPIAPSPLVPVAPILTKSPAPAPAQAPAPVITAVPPIPPKAPPATAPQVPPQKPEAHPELKDDIANILKEIKLPERRDDPSAKQPAPKEIKTFDTTLGAKLEGLSTPQPTAASTQPAYGAPPAAESGVPTEKSSVVSVHTLKDDLQHVVRDQKISVVHAVSLEEDRRHRLVREEKAAEAAGVPTVGQTQRSKRALGIIFSILLLLILGGAALGGVYLIAQQRAGSASPPQGQSLIFAESTVALSLGNQSGIDLKRILGNARTNASGTLGSITRILPTVIDTAEDGTTATRAATFAEFMNAIQSGAPDDLLRATGSDFFFGIHTVDKNAPLIVVPVTSYDRAFAAMLAWEGTMNAGLAPIFTPLPAQTTDASGLPVTRSFQDIVMRNYDVRALKDDAGNVTLYYSFPTQNILIIAESPYSFAEILSRLQAERRL